MRAIQPKAILDSLPEFKQEKKSTSVGRVSSGLIQDMLASVNIADVLEQEYDLYLIPGSGGWLTTNCPMPAHRDSSPSFGVNPEKGIYNCFGCQEKGNLLDFIKKVEGLSFPEAVLRLSQITGFALDDSDAELNRSLRDIDGTVNEYLSRQSDTDLPGGISILQYLRSIADRLRQYELKTERDPQEVDWVDSVYKDIDRAVLLEDQVQLNKIWSQIGKEMKKRFIEYQLRHIQDLLEEVNEEEG